ncbi:ABC transporter permease [Miniphocaeibacter halophilus]|uniref:ABC transporter permease n=1 Tax=Miniphocaeibacter halophilus TaxID=2931922 RepID=A0AC61MVD0_9FIRM|nr:ABC transporter permease [Miniphocaeibacter halophilus]QQK08041.1 ABC transporter permease [Miniphocaeibacter halophilus]
MVKIKNKESILLLTNRFIKSYKKNSLSLILGMSLIITLIVSLTTMLYTNHRLESIQNQFIYTNMDYEIKNLSMEQIKELQENKTIENLGIEKYLSTIKTKNNQAAVIISANTDSILKVSKLIEGKMPKNKNEIVAEKWTLLNLGINPIVGTEFSFPIKPGNVNNKYKIVGILNDMPLNKMGGAIILYTNLVYDDSKEYLVHLKFKENINIEKEIEKIENELEIPNKNIVKNPWLENKEELIIANIKLNALLLLIGGLIVFGIYRISLIKREKQFGMLRAIGVTKKQVKKIMILELLKLYFYSIPIGIIIGFLSVKIITNFSNDENLKIFFWGKLEKFNIIYPINEIIISILMFFIVLVFVGVIGSRGINGVSIIKNITGHGNTGKDKFSLVNITGEENKNLLLKKLSMKYIFTNVKTSFIVILSLIIGGTLFYGLAYKSYIIEEINNIQTRTNFYNSDYLLTAYDDMDIGKGISELTLNNIKNIDGIQSIETQIALPIKVVDNNESRNKEYLNNQEKIVNSHYGFSLRGKDKFENLYHTKLKGYNDNALEKLKKYIVEGNIDNNNLKENEIIIAMPRTSSYGKSKGAVGYFKNGLTIIDYKVGDTITIKYTDINNINSERYWNFSDINNKYMEKDYKISAIVYYPYMKSVSLLEQVYPLLITSEENIRKIVNNPTYLTINVNRNVLSSKTNDRLIEEKLIELAVENGEVTARSLIEEKEKIDTMYKKELIYIYGIAVVTFILVLLNLTNNLKYRIQIRREDFYIYKAIGMEIDSLKKIIYFENMIFSILSLFFIVIFSKIVSKFLYYEAELYLYGIEYRYNYPIIIILAMFTLMISFIISYFLNKNLKNVNIIEKLSIIE